MFVYLANALPIFSVQIMITYFIPSPDICCIVIATDAEDDIYFGLSANYTMYSFVCC